MNAILRWADFLPSCLHSTRLFLRLCTSLFPLWVEWQKEWLTAGGRWPRRHTAARARIRVHGESSNSSFMFHVWGAERRCTESPISMTTGLRIRVKNCHSRAIVRAPWFRRALKSEGKEESTGVGKEGIWVGWKDQGRNVGMGNDPAEGSLLAPHPYSVQVTVDERLPPAKQMCGGKCVKRWEESGRSGGAEEEKGGRS